jgi:TPR repeat protein
MDAPASSQQWLDSLILSAAHGDADAAHQLAQMHADPASGVHDPVKAQRYFEWAAHWDPSLLPPG